MKRTTGFGILSAVAILASGVLSAAPQGPDNDRQAGGPPGAPREMLKRAGATDAQIQALADADYALQVKQIDLRAAAEKAQLALERLMTSTNVDEKAVMAAADTLNQAHGELFKLELAMELKRKQILGDELMKKLQHVMRPPLERQGNPMPGMGGPNMGPNAAGGPNASGPQEEGNRQLRGRSPRMAPDEGNRPLLPRPPDAD